ncbi:MAG: PAS domain-containing protein, partial [Candidatus Methanoperedens sp.]|nr:PAS domain-containing protein [Candidatus Methanoperedens sp.]
MGDPDFQDGRWEKTCREDYWFFLTDGISKDLSVHDYIDIYIKWYEVSTFEDLTIRVKDFAKSFVDTIHEPFLLLDKDKKVIYVNRSFCDTFKVTVDETIGNVLYDIGKREW